jgi:hypothetical protein
MSAIEMTKAIVIGRKNSAPALSANGRPITSPTPAISVSAASRRSRLGSITGGGPSSVDAGVSGALGATAAAPPTVADKLAPMPLSPLLIALP